MKTRLALVASAAAVMAGCGGGGAPGTRPAADASAAGRARLASSTETERILGSSFRRGLDRLAVMTQVGDDPADLGQSLPTGLLDRTECSAAQGSDLRCLVHWQTVEGRREATRYVVQRTQRGCVYANARPTPPQILDVTTEAPAESPLSFLVGAVRGC